MEETIKGIEVIAYKYMDANMRCCGGFQYEIGKTYKANQVKLNECGFHACLNPTTVLEYQPMQFARYFKVLLSGEITKCNKWDTNIAATEITILEEITDDFHRLYKTDYNWWKNKNVLDLLYYQEGFAAVRRGDNLYNFIDEKGNLLSDEWFSTYENFKNGFAIVRRKDKLCNFINKQGKIISDEWFDWCSQFNKQNFGSVIKTNGDYSKIDKNGKLWM